MASLLAALPQGSDALHRGLLEAAVASEPRALELLRALSVVREAPTVPDLALLSGLDEAGVRAGLAALGSLFVSRGPEGRERVSEYHKSVVDLLVDRGRAGGALYCDPAACHRAVSGRLSARVAATLGPSAPLRAEMVALLGSGYALRHAFPHACDAGEWGAAAALVPGSLRLVKAHAEAGRLDALAAEAIEAARRCPVGAGAPAAARAALVDAERWLVLMNRPRAHASPDWVCGSAYGSPRETAVKEAANASGVRAGRLLNAFELEGDAQLVNEPFA
ncbi:MAG: hypothetical protein ACO26C_08020, partial [Ilumatobacteraceae bacterium]